MRSWIVLFWIVLSLTITLTSGCASVSAIPNTASSENQEERVQKLLTGTWGGYIKDTPYAIISYNTPTMKIFWVERTNKGEWIINLSWNRKRVDAELTVDSTMIRIEFIEHWENRTIHHSLVLYGENRMVGKIWYGSRSFFPTEVTLEKRY